MTRTTIDRLIINSPYEEPQRYPGVTSITKRLLDHWRDPEAFDARRFFFCQLEAVETLIWLTELARLFKEDDRRRIRLEQSDLPQCGKKPHQYYS